MKTESPSEHRHTHTDEVVCPHCGYEHGDSYEWFNDGKEDTEDECSGCGKLMLMTIHYEITYSTKKP